MSAIDDILYELSDDDFIDCDVLRVKRKDAVKELAALRAEIASLRSFIEDWNSIFPDEGPREVKAKIEKKDAALLLAEKVLKINEWQTSGENLMIAFCEICDAFGEIPEHMPDCELAAALSVIAEARKSDAG